MATHERVLLRLSPQERILLDELKKVENLKTDAEALLFALRKATSKSMLPSADHGYLARWRETSGIPPATRPEISVKQALGARLGGGSGSAGGSDRGGGVDGHGH